ncbi:MAG: V-type ATPase subunit [Clostridia bacterium]|nr:V-type ATPase subunit [Clostridia bacterium]
MKDTEYAFAVARIRSNENKLLSSATVESAITASDYNEALKVFADSGYADFANEDEEKILTEKQREAFELIYSTAPDKKCIDFLIVKNDFHNFKAILKSMVQNKSVDGLLLTPSIVDTKDAVKAVTEKQFDRLPEKFVESVKKAYDVLVTTLDGQLCDMVLDKACLEMILGLAKESKDAFAVSLANKMTALYDIKIAMRCMRTGKDESFVMDSLAKCDVLDVSRLAKASISGEDTFYEYVKFLSLGNLAECVRKSYAAFEKEIDDILIDSVKDAKYHCLGLAPLAAYYFAVENEVKTVRIILSCKKNGMSVETIRERVRKLYV